MVNRRELDKQAAYQAQQSGAEIMVKTSFKEKTGQVVQTSAGEIKCKILVDCRGVSRLVNSEQIWHIVVSTIRGLCGLDY